MTNTIRLLILAAVTAVAPPLTEDRLTALLADYHVHRVDSAHRVGETEAERLERMRRLASGLLSACDAVFPALVDSRLGWDRTRCVALGAATIEWESGLLLEVHSGKRLGPAGERCVFQLHRKVSAVPDPRYRVTAEDLARVNGVDAESTDLCTLSGVKTIAWQIHRCGLRADDFAAPAKLFSLYHHPRLCDDYVLSGMPAQRARTYRWIDARLRSLE